jgi:hypothetical protein
MAADTPELLFDLARAALEHQERQVSELRSRTQALLTAAALVASFLGSTAIERGGLDVAAVGALAALCATLVACLFLLLPRRAEFTLDVRDLQHLGDARDLAATHVMVANTLWKAHQYNDVALERMAWTFSGAAAILVLQVALWGCALVVG